MSRGISQALDQLSVPLPLCRLGSYASVWAQAPLIAGPRSACRGSGASAGVLEGGQTVVGRCILSCVSCFMTIVTLRAQRLFPSPPACGQGLPGGGGLPSGPRLLPWGHGSGAAHCARAWLGPQVRTQRLLSHNVTGTQRDQPLLLAADLSSTIHTEHEDWWSQGSPCKVKFRLVVCRVWSS